MSYNIAFFVATDTLLFEMTWEQADFVQTDEDGSGSKRKLSWVWNWLSEQGESLSHLIQVALRRGASRRRAPYLVGGHIAEAQVVLPLSLVY